jgi:hypothetical protein
VDNSYTDIGQDRPNVIPGVRVYTRPQIQRLGANIYLNQAAFCSVSTSTPPCSNPVAPGAYGTSTRNAYRGLTSYQFDAQVSRIFPVHERLNATLRLEAFNVLNHPNFGNPDSGLTSSTFGRISSSGSARIFQGSVKLNF